MVSDYGKVILIGGARYVGKSSLATALSESRGRIVLSRFDFNTQLYGMLSSTEPNEFKTIVHVLANNLPVILDKINLTIDYCLQDEYTEILRNALRSFDVYNVWLHCKADEEIERRKTIAEYEMTDAEAKKRVFHVFDAEDASRLEYDMNVDLLGSSAECVSEEILVNALHQWGN